MKISSLQNERRNCASASAADETDDGRRGSEGVELHLGEFVDVIVVGTRQNIFMASLQGMIFHLAALLDS
jgi:hypothetical protein